MSVQRYTTSQCVWSESRRWLLPFHFILIFCRAELLWLQSTLRFGVIIGVTSLALYSRGMSCKLQNLSKQTCFHETLCWWGKLLWVSDISQSLRKLFKWKTYFCMLIFMNCLALDTLAEWLRRRPAKPMGSPRAGSNPAGVAYSNNNTCSSKPSAEKHKRKDISYRLLAGIFPTNHTKCRGKVLLKKWTHWGLNPGPSACEADVIPLHHRPNWHASDQQR